MSKKIPEALLALLSDGQFHSGVAIGEALGVSRAAVWKQLQKLDELGLTLESVKGKGYRLPGGLDHLDADIIAAGLTLPAVEILTDIDSTNAEMLRRLAGAEVPSGSVLVAEQQSAGRGRRGREWVSPFAKNLYFSMVWNFANGAAALDGLSLVVGLSVVEALHALGVGKARLKWPNDVLFEGQKLAGVLLEISGDATGLCHVVVGVGLNVKMRPEDSSGISQAWTSVERCLGQSVDRSEVLNQVLARLLVNIAQFQQQGLGPFITPWSTYDAFAAKDVVVSLGERQIFGVSRGIDERGQLLLDVNGQLQSFNGGEVSLRRVL